MHIFILGIIFALSVMPLLDSFTSLVITFFEMLKSYMSVVINNNSVKIQETMNNKGTSHAIGFVYSDPREEEEIDDEE